MHTRFWITLTAFALASTLALGNALAEKSPVNRDAGTSSSNAGQLSRQQMIFLSSNLNDLGVYNTRNEKLGSLNDLVIDAHTGQVLHGILSTGILGKSIPVPWTAFRLEKKPDQDRYWLVLNISKDQLANAPTFDKKHMPKFTDAKWQETVDRFFGVRTVARPTDLHRSK